jgi:parallel beta helix pectate lyase-like protein
VSITGATVSDVGNDGISFLDHNTISISDTSVSGTGEFGISMRDHNGGFSITRTTISDVCCAGIAMEEDNSGVISDTSIADSHTFGIFMMSDNTVAIRNVAITTAEINGLEIMGPDNEVELSNSTFSGDFGTLGFPGYAISIDDTANALSGTGNVYSAGTVGGLCSAVPGQVGQFTFTSSATCPP